MYDLLVAMRLTKLAQCLKEEEVDGVSVSSASTLCHCDVNVVALAYLFPILRNIGPGRVMPYEHRRGCTPICTRDADNEGQETFAETGLYS